MAETSFTEQVATFNTVLQAIEPERHAARCPVDV